MELTLGRLKAALIAGKIPVTDEALAILRAGLDTITHGYHLNRVLREIKTETELKKDLSRLYLACPTFILFPAVGSWQNQRIRADAMA